MKIAVVEDSPVMQRLLLVRLARLPGVEVVGTTGSEPEAIALIERTRPDVVLLDLFLTPGHGLQVLQAMRTGGNTCQVLVLTSEPLHDEYLRRGSELGVSSFHEKGDGLSALVEQLERLMGEGLNRQL